MGIVIGPIILAYFLIAALIPTFVKPQKWKWGILAVYVAVPFGDHFLGWLYFRYHCAVTAGQHVYRVVDGVEGFSVYDSYGEGYLLMGPYKYVEAYGRYGKGKFIFFIENGEINKSDISEFSSQYIFRMKEKDSFYNLNFRNFDIEDKDAKLIARLTKVAFLGGWVMRATERYSIQCHTDSIQLNEFIVSVLKPTN